MDSKICLNCNNTFKRKELNYYVSPSKFIHVKYCSNNCRIEKELRQTKKYNKKTYTRDFVNWFWACRECHQLHDGLQKKVIKIDKITGKKLEEYNSIKEASELNKIHNTNISLACSGGQKTAGGFIWEYPKYDNKNLFVGGGL